MDNKIVANTIPMRLANGPQVFEAAVLGGLRNRTGCIGRILENPEKFEIAVEIECSEGFWSRKFSSLREVEPEFICRAVEEAIFADRR